MNRVELIAKADPQWAEYIRSMCEARTKANLLRVKLEYLRMRHTEQQSLEASKRQEMRMT